VTLPPPGLLADAARGGRRRGSRPDRADLRHACDWPGRTRAGGSIAGPDALRLTELAARRDGFDASALAAIKASLDAVPDAARDREQALVLGQGVIDAIREAATGSGGVAERLSRALDKDHGVPTAASGDVGRPRVRCLISRRPDGQIRLASHSIMVFNFVPVAFLNRMLF
jgi:hypothetical protein